MAGASSDNDDGSEIFWPGYVDATTNLILNLLFLLTILIVAVFMFALELGRAVGPQDANAEFEARAEIEATEIDPAAENIALKNEIKRLQALLEKKQVSQINKTGEAKTVSGTQVVPKAEKGLSQALPGDFELLVRFNKDSVSFTPEEREQLLQDLKPVIADDKALIYVGVPAGFSEAKRMGFYRALAVRNLLIQMGVPTKDIDVSVVEGAADADAAVVKVRSR
ncbi:MAG: hypothetical protein C0615_06275 [Desulfuromonas sp.]|nr:MAG: hypothetical protein C0615_06275 [Desulfuromonas sp.]